MISRATLIGTISKKIRGKAKNGIDFLTLMVVTRRAIRDRNGVTHYELPSTHPVNAYDRMAEMIDKELEEGDLVYVEGSIQNNPSMNSEIWSYRIKADEIKKIISQDVEYEL